jgi:hypothetical protein
MKSLNISQTLIKSDLIISNRIKLNFTDFNKVLRELSNGVQHDAINLNPPPPNKLKVKHLIHSKNSNKPHTCESGKGS